MSPFWLIFLLSIPHNSRASKRLFEKGEGKANLVYTGPDQLSDVQRRAHAIKNDARIGLIEGAVVATGSYSYPVSGAIGAVNSVGKAVKAAGKGQVLKAVGHTVAAPAQVVAGLAGGAASLAASPLPAIAGLGSAAYQTVRMGTDEGKKIVSRESEAQRERRRTKNVDKTIKRTESGIKFVAGTASKLYHSGLTLAGEKVTAEDRLLFRDRSRVQRSKSSRH